MAVRLTWFFLCVLRVLCGENRRVKARCCSALLVEMLLDFCERFNDSIGPNTEPLHGSAGAIDPEGAKAESLRARGIPSVRRHEAHKRARHAKRFFRDRINAG